jgi:very-short-patch-repair endonuclease
MRHQWTECTRELRKHSTAAERKIWFWLRRRYLGGTKFRRQHPIDDRYVLDFYCAELKLCIELGGGVHDTALKVASDVQRTRELAARGVTVVRLRNDYVADQPDGAWSVIVAAVVAAQRQHAGPKSRPSP